MKFRDTQLFKFFRDVLVTFTSAEKIKSLIGIPLYSNAILLLLGNLLTAGCGFVFWIIVARFYTPDAVGTASAALSAVSLLATIANLGLGYGLIRFLPGAGSDARAMINSCLMIGAISSIITAVIFIVGIDLWSPGLSVIRETPYYLLTFILFTLLYTTMTITDYIHVGSRKANIVLGRNIIYNLLRIPLPIFLAGVFHSFGIFSSWVMAMLASLIVSLMLLKVSQPAYRPALSIDKKITGRIIGYSFVNYLSAMFWAIPSMVFPLLVINILGAETNAYFYIAWAVGIIISGIPTAMATSLFAEGSHDEQSLWLNVKRSLRAMALLMIPVVAIVTVFADKILWLFGNTYPENASTLLRIVALSSLPLAINIIYLFVKRVQKDTKIIVGLPTVIMILGIGLAYLMMKEMSIDGVGYAWLLSQTVVALAVIFSWIKRRGNK
jgi:O-antigen/teichoic acid export membrane protein